MEHLIAASLPEQRRIAESWLAALGDALDQRDFRRVAGMIHPEGYWRDLLTFGWEFKTLHGAQAVESWLSSVFDLNAAHNFRLEGDPTIDAIEQHSRTLEFFFGFDTPIASG